MTCIGQSHLDDRFMVGKDFPKEAGKVSAKTYADAQGTCGFGKEPLFVGINDLLNTKSPLFPSGLPDHDTGVETDGGRHP